MVDIVVDVDGEVDVDIVKVDGGYVGDFHAAR